MISGTREAVSDTSPTQYLHQTGYLRLLDVFDTRTLIPPAVAYELELGRAIDIDFPEVSVLPWIKIQAHEGLDKVPTAADLGAGERGVLALRLQVPNPVVILDERIGPLEAGVLKLTFTSTLGILMRAKVEGRIRQLEPVLAHLDRLGFRLSAKTRASVLKLAGE
jgi:predicted nucleic acid-binding protein